MASMRVSPGLYVALLLVLGCWLVMSTTDEIRSIGEAYVEKPLRGRRLLHKRHGQNKKLQQSDVTSLANRRSLLYALCSDTDNSPEAVRKCTNAMRSDPNAFAKEFRCGTYWMNNMNKLGELKANGVLNGVAQKHAEDNARMGKLSHTGSDGSRPSERARRGGYEYSYVSENIAWGYTSAKDVVLGWMCSDGHRRNILSCEVSEIGIGIAKGSDGRYYHAQVFGCPSGGSCSCSGGPTGGGGGGKGGSGSGSPYSPYGGGSGGHGGKGGHGGGHGSGSPYSPYGGGSGGHGGKGGHGGGQGGHGGQYGPYGGILDYLFKKHKSGGGSPGSHSGHSGPGSHGGSGGHGGHGGYGGYGGRRGGHPKGRTYKHPHGTYTVTHHGGGHDGSSGGY